MRYKNKEKEVEVIEWTGKNLEDVLEFTGKHPKFDKWFKSMDDFKVFLRDKGNLLRIYRPEGDLYVYPGYWISKDDAGKLDMIFNSDLMLFWKRVD